MNFALKMMSFALKLMNYHHLAVVHRHRNRPIAGAASRRHRHEETIVAAHPSF